MSFGITTVAGAMSFAGSAMSVASGINRLMSDTGPGGSPQYGGSRSDAMNAISGTGLDMSAANQLSTLMSNPGQILQDPVYQAFQQNSNASLQRTMGAQGQGQSGAEQAALQQNATAGAGQFYNQQVGNLTRIASGGNQADATRMGMQGAAAYGQGQQAGWTSLQQGLGGLGGIFGKMGGASSGGATGGNWGTGYNMNMYNAPDLGFAGI